MYVQNNNINKAETESLELRSLNTSATAPIKSSKHGDNAVRNLENQVLQIREYRHNGSPKNIIERLLQKLSWTYENEIKKVMYEWLPGTSIDKIDDLANLIIRVRDVHGEFGERDAAYILLCTWYIYFPEWAVRIFHRFVGGIGCWSDVKYMCKILLSFELRSLDPVVVVRERSSQQLTSKVTFVDRKSLEEFRNNIIDIMLNQLYADYTKWNEVMENYLENRRQYFGIGEKYEGENENGGWKRTREPLMKRPEASRYISLASKWCPREKSKFGWLFKLLIQRMATKNVPYTRSNPRKMFSENARKLRHILRATRVTSTNHEKDT
jgi:hypothetical protein